MYRNHDPSDQPGLEVAHEAEAPQVVEVPAWEKAHNQQVADHSQTPYQQPYIPANGQYPPSEYPPSTFPGTQAGTFYSSNDLSPPPAGRIP